MSTSLSQRKSFEISKWEVWQAYQRVKANKGAPGTDGVSIEEFGTDLQGNLYKVWNRMATLPGRRLWFAAWRSAPSRWGGIAVAWLCRELLGISNYS